MYLYLFLIFIVLAQCDAGEERSEVNKSLRAPSHLGLTTSAAGVEVSWRKLEDNASNPIVGYKIKYCEVPDHVVYKYENDVDSQVFVQETRPAEPFADLKNADQNSEKTCKVIVTALNATSATIKRTRPHITYEIRVLAFTKTEEGPLSNTVGVRINDDKTADYSTDDIDIITN